MSDRPVPDTDSAIDFLTRYSGNDPIMLTAIVPDGGGVESLTVRPETEAEKARQWIDKHQGRANIHFTVNPTIRPMSGQGIKAKKTDIRALKALHVDIDPRVGEDFAAERDRAVRVLQNFNPPASIIIDSGNGFQGFWLLDEEHAIDGSEDRAVELERYNQQIALGLHADACQDVSRVMRLDAKPYGAKVGEIITRHLTAEGVEQLLAPRDILDPAFKQHLDSLTSAEAKAAEIEHAIRHEIHVHRDENPTAYTSLWEQVERIVNERREARVSAASALARLQEIAAKVADVRAGSSPSGKGLSGVAGAILPFLDDAMAGDGKPEAATDVAKALESYAIVVDWQHKEDVQRQMRRAIKERLRTLGLDAGKIEAVTAKVMDVARARLAR